MPTDTITIDSAVEAAESLLPPVQESQDVAVREERSVVLAEDREVVMADPILAQAAAIARLPGLNEAMFAKLMEWQKEERAAQAKERFTEIMNLCQREIEPVARAAENTQTRSFYAKLEAVDAAIRPIYTKHGFTVSYDTIAPLTPGNIRVECRVSLGRHTELYHREAKPDTLGPKGTPVKTELHGGASSETFMKRYALCGAFNIVFRNQDDDGNRGGAEYISDEKVEQITALIDETGTDPASFFTVMITEPISTYAEIQVKDFDRLMHSLQAKQRRMTRRKEDANDPA